jgi:hypothetical protein
MGLNVACQSCPDGNADNSLFCHSAQCATEETICSGACSNLKSDRDNCGACGRQCGDGLVCASGECVEGCAGGLVNCGNACVDPASDNDNCGGCAADDPSFVCRPDQTCSGGTCGCTQSQVICAGACTDPMTNPMYCGASADCAGTNAGTRCDATEGCLDGACTSRLIYRGSLPATSGRWQFQAQLGIAGANAECAARWPGSEICTYTKLLSASVKATPETIMATDFNNVPVTTWWIDDPAAVGGQRCMSNADQIPWSYATADQGHVGKFVTLDRGTGAISALTVDALPSCNQNRFVPCCSKITAP